MLALAAERLWPAVAPTRRARWVTDRTRPYLALYVAVAVPAVTLIGSGAATVLQRLDGGFTAPSLRRPAAVGAGGRRARAHRPGQLDLALVQPPGRRVLALPRAAPLAGGDEHPHRPSAPTRWCTRASSSPRCRSSCWGPVARCRRRCSSATSCSARMPHANVNWGFGPLRYVIVSPAYHRLHHDRDDRRGVNLGTVLVLWDVLAGLAVFPDRRRDADAAGPMRCRCRWRRGWPAGRCPVEQELEVAAPAWHGPWARQLLVARSRVRGRRTAGRSAVAAAAVSMALEHESDRVGRSRVGRSRVGRSVQWLNGWQHRWQAAGETWWRSGRWWRQPSS